MLMETLKKSVDVHLEEKKLLSLSQSKDPRQGNHEPKNGDHPFAELSLHHILLEN